MIFYIQPSKIGVKFRNMLEKFTQKAIDIVQNAQIQAGNFNSDKVYSEHILLALALNNKGVEAKLIGAEKIDRDVLIELTNQKISSKRKPKKREYISFSASAKTILEKSVEIAKQYNNPLILPAHIALAIFFSKNSGAYEILREFDIDEEKIVSNLCRLIEKNSNKTYYKHPEKQETQPQTFNNIDNLLDEHTVSHLLKTAQSKLSTMGYEILGTEQIVQSILDNSDNDITKILESYGISRESFDNELKNFSDRNEEYGERKIIFTPNAFRAMLLSLDTAREMGSVEIRPEHIVLGILKAKRGIAYKIFDKLSSHTLNFEEALVKDINSSSNVPETLAILRFAKAEAANYNKKTVGTEMILLGILSRPNIAYEVLKKLGISLKDVRREVESLVGYGAEENNNDFEYSLRAKKMLDIAYSAAKRHGKTKIVSEHLLYAITKQPDCLAMKVLENLGTDVLEIKQGILQELNSGIIRNIEF